MNKTCEACGKPCPPRKKRADGRSGGRPQRFCSTRCKTRTIRRRLMGLVIVRPCRTCGTKTTWQKRGLRFYCSIECRDIKQANADRTRRAKV